MTVGGADDLVSLDVGVGGGVVGETNWNTVLGELMTVGGADDLVSLDVGVGNLATDVLVADPNNHTVLGGVVFILVLDHKTLPGVVVGLTLPASAELDLEPLEVSLVLDDFDVHHLDGCSLKGCSSSEKEFWAWDQ